MGRGDDRAKVLAGFVDLPSHLVVLVADLHGSLVLVPVADFPGVIVGRELVLKVPRVDVVTGTGSSFANEDQLQPAVCHGVHLIVEVRIVRRDADAGHARLQELGIASVSIPAILPPAVFVMVSDRCEVWEVGSENAVDGPEEPTRVLGVVKVALVHDYMGSLRLDELEHASERRTITAIADKGDFQVRVRGDRARRSLCVTSHRPEGKCEEGCQNATGDEA